MTSFNELLMDEKPVYIGALAAYPHSPELIKKLSVTDRFGEPVRLWTPLDGGKLIGVPRALCPACADDRRVTLPPINFDCKVVPRNEDQTKLIEESSALLLKGDSHILQAMTGFGKTVIANAIIARVKQPTLVVVTKEDLTNQWFGELQKFLSLKPTDIGFIQQDRYDVSGKKVCIGMVHSLALDARYPAWITKLFGLVIFDEVHRLGAETFSRVCSLFPAKLRLGLSATPERADGCEIIFMSHIGPVRVRGVVGQMVPKVLAYTSRWMCPRITRAGKVVRLPHEPGKVMHILTKMAKDSVRNKLMADCVGAAYKKGRKQVFFSELAPEKHLDTMRGLIMGAGVPSKDIAFYIGGMSAKERDIASAKPVILATYKMMSEGTNIPWLDVCHLGMPRSDVEQIVGRIRREYPDKPQPIVFDYIDRDSPVFAGYANKRMNWYKDIGANVVRMN